MSWDTGHTMRGRCHHGFMLQILCLFLWGHLENISALLLRRCFLWAFIIHSFSSRQRLHRFAPLLYALARFKMDHFTENWRALFFSFQMLFDSTVVSIVVSAPISNSSQTKHTHHRQVIRKTEQEISLGSTRRSVKTLKPTSARNSLAYSIITSHFLIP